MKIEGQFEFENTSAQPVWDFLTDAERIAQCLPGCEKLTKTGEDTYDLQMRFGIGAIGGIFTGSIRIHDLHPISEFHLSVSGAGSPGFTKGDGKIELAPSDSSTLLTYTGDVSAGGPIASLGHRMIGGAARMVIEQFFKCVAKKMGT